MDKVLIYLIFSSAIAVCVYTCEKPVCKENEMVVENPVDCPRDFCPSSAHEDEECGQPQPCPACKCIFNYRRSNGTCISTRKCPPFECPDNEEFNGCPPYCPTDDCSMAKYNGQCPPLFGENKILLICEPKCRCKPGFYRNDKKICVPAKECPSTTTA